MPTYSIIIPTYGNARYLPACLDSLQAQGFKNWQAVVVIDASPDESSVLAHERAAGDERIVVVDKPVNEGLHLARKTGMGFADGDYILFLDADDELEPDALARIDEALAADPCDLLRIGTNVVADGVSPEAAEAYAERANRPFPAMGGRESIRLCYEEEGGFVQDWRAWANVMAAPVAKRAFDAMCDTRLERAEDAYEFLVLLSFVKRQFTRTDIVGHRYFFGRGVTGSGKLDADTFVKHAGQFARCMDAMQDYADSFDAFDLAPAARGGRVKLTEIMFSDWTQRVSDDEKMATVEPLAELIGTDAVAAELMRIVRDEAYRLCDADELPAPDAALFAWYDKAKQLAVDEPSMRYKHFAAFAKNHLADLERIRRAHSFADERIRIFVSCHKPANRFDSRVLQPVHVGAAKAPFKLFGTLSDDTGDNISDLNPLYCELTAQYWAWKNAEADYYGFCHYRRYFNFSDVEFPENGWGEVIDEYIDAETQAKYGLTDDAIRAAVEGFDVITTKFNSVADFPDDSQTVLSQWSAAQALSDDDLVAMMAILIEHHPEYREDVEAYLNGERSCFCNMFVMRKDIFFDYCEWLFPLLEEFVRTTDMSLYSHEELRTPGHLSERLFNLYYLHHLRTGANWKTKEVQCVHFLVPATQHDLSPLPPQAYSSKPIVPVVFASDNNYVPMLTTTIYSMLRNASARYHYDITVMTTDITAENCAAMKKFLEPLGSVTLTFYNVESIIHSFDLSTNNEHIGIETYYRFLVQDILPHYDKVLYLDSDLIIEGDVAELYETELADNLLAAVRDVDYLGNLNMRDGKRLAYTREVLKMDNPYDYFQAGVLVLNTHAFRAEIPVRTWLEDAQDTRYIYNDQDILNARCEGRVVFLDPEWNVMHDGWHRIGAVCSAAPAAIFDAYLEARKHEKVIHYAGSEKPWNTYDCDRMEHYWDYARRTPFYEQLMALFVHDSAAHLDGRTIEEDAPVIGENNPIRKIADPLLPPGSRRREAARSLAKKIRGL